MHSHVLKLSLEFNLFWIQASFRYWIPPSSFFKIKLLAGMRQSSKSFNLQERKNVAEWTNLQFIEIEWMVMKRLNELRQTKKTTIEWKAKLEFELARKPRKRLLSNQLAVNLRLNEWFGECPNSSELNPAWNQLLVCWNWEWNLN